MKKIKKDLLVEGEFAVHVKTEEQMNIVLRALGQDVDKYSFGAWRQYTCLGLTSNNRVLYGDYDFYDNQTDYFIYDYDEIWENANVIKLQDFEEGKIYTHSGVQYKLEDDCYYERQLDFLGSKCWLELELKKKMFDWEFLDCSQIQFSKRINVGDIYYYLSDCGLIDWTYYDDDDVDKYRIKIGNFFETREEVHEYKIKIVKNED